ncbi:MAG: hypothetical protein P2975_05170 [Gemmatimonadota bacterium]|jgi:hypothetical protein|nr:hypothetical protein [Gemmatimonadota bacterium]MDQ8169807.1 hypothetical protein [Gemmatimonadota bacterium]MDQ8174117.1 hypothetical protein [Gemmatimonadota bacterium]
MTRFADRRTAGWITRGLLGMGLALSASIVGAQIAPVLGPEQDRPSVRWQVIEGRHARVIAPVGMEREARRLSATIDRIARADTLTLRARPPKIDIVLRAQYANANGFVALAPRRSELFPQAPQFDGLLGANDWLELLALHEYRHVQQLTAARRGFTGVMTALFGEVAWQTFTFWSLPSWFLEGDATLAETVLTSSGRGRIPLFDADFRAQLLARDVPSYQTTMVGSLKDRWPSPYVHGYHLLAAGRARFGAEVWEQALARSTRRSFIPVALSGGLRRTSGVTAAALHQQTFGALRDAVRAGAARLALTPVVPVGIQPTIWTADAAPGWEDDTRLITHRVGLDAFPQLVRHGGEEVERLQYLGQATPAPLSVQGGTAAWIEERFDPRFALRTFNVIMLRDLASGEVRQLGDTTRWMSVGLSSDAQRLVTIEQRPDGGTSLLILDREGQVRQRHAVPDGDLLVTPRFTREGDGVLLTRTRRGVGRRVERCDPAMATCEGLSPWSSLAIAAPVGDSTLVFAYAPIDGRDQIVAWRAATGRWHQVTVRPVGAIDPMPSPDGTRLAFLDHTASGRRLVTMPIAPERWPEVTLVAEDAAPLRALIAQVGAAPLAEPIAPDSAAPLRDYVPWRHLLYPTGFTVSLPPLSPTIGATLSSRDILGTFAADLGASYDRTERTGSGRIAITSAASPAITSAWVGVGDRRDVYPAATVRGEAQPAGEWRWREQTRGVRAELPLNLTRDHRWTQLRFFGSLEETRVEGSTLPAYFVSDEGSVRPLTVGVSAYRGYQWVRDIFPIRGVAASAFVRSTPLGGTFDGRQVAARAQLFRSGFGAHHGVRLDLGVDRQPFRASATSAPPYRFATSLPFARGYPAVTAPVAVRGAVDYAFPLWYPDRTLVRAIQLQRVRGALFADLMQTTTRRFVQGVAVDAQTMWRSVGAELWFDAAWFHPELKIPVGVRYAWRLDGARGGQAEFIIGL